MRCLLIALSLCLLCQNAPLAANAGVVSQGREYSDVDIERILLKNSLLRYTHDEAKVAALSIQLLNKNKTPLTWKQQRDIFDKLLPNRDRIRELTRSDDALKYRLRERLSRLLQEIFNRKTNMGQGNAWQNARKVTDILIPDNATW